ncbi:hypothetical protein MHYP_G00139970 [Metynnis hypsauchen]
MVLVSTAVVTAAVSQHSAGISIPDMNVAETSASPGLLISANWCGCLSAFASVHMRCSLRVACKQHCLQRVEPLHPSVPKSHVKERARGASTALQ